MEEWRDVKGYEGLYQVSSEGRVKSLARYTTKGKVLTSRIQQRYLSVCLSKENKKRSVRVHRLVAQAFIPNPEGKPEVNHKDGDKLNNRAQNLEWTTRSENELHSYRQLGKAPLRYWAGKPRKCARLFTDEQIRTIRKDKRSSREVCEDYGVSRTTIKNIRAKKIYKEVV